MKQGKILLVAAIGAFAIVLVMSALARAEDCPPGVASCKVVVITPQELQTLEGPNAIFDAAEFANKMGLSGLITQWKAKIAASPDGKVVKPDANGNTVPLPPEKKK